jgi:hypothetical protein
VRSARDLNVLAMGENPSGLTGLAYILYITLP